MICSRPRLRTLKDYGLNLNLKSKVKRTQTVHYGGRSSEKIENEKEECIEAEESKKAHQDSIETSDGRSTDGLYHFGNASKKIGLSACA